MTLYVVVIKKINTTFSKVTSNSLCIGVFKKTDAPTIYKNKRLA